MDMMHLIQVVIVAIVEGLTEFLPVSSTGHMALAGELIGFTGPAEASFMIIIQLGAILAVCVVYWRRLLNVALAAVSPRPQSLLTSETGEERLYDRREARNFIRNVLLAFIPSMILGLLTYKAIKAAIGSPIIICWALLLGGIAILIIERMTHRNAITRVEDMTIGTALKIGAAQCLSLIPGVSRSGATIMGALVLGVERKTAAEFTFFLAIPTMAGATTYDVYKNWSSFQVDDLVSLAIGFVVAFVVALAVVRGFVGFVGRYGFAPFAWYRIVVGLAGILWLSFK